MGHFVVILEMGKLFITEQGESFSIFESVLTQICEPELSNFGVVFTVLSSRRRFVHSIFLSTLTDKITNHTNHGKITYKNLQLSIFNPRQKLTLLTG